MNYKETIVEQFSVVGMEYNSQTSSESIAQMWDRFIPRENEIQAKINPAYQLRDLCRYEGRCICLCCRLSIGS